MKVRITFDVTDDQRIAISASQGEGFKPASRDEIVELIDTIVFDRLENLGATYRKAMEDIVSRLQTTTHE